MVYPRNAHDVAIVWPGCGYSVVMMRPGYGQDVISGEGQDVPNM